MSCEDCNDTGLIETEGLNIARIYPVAELVGKSDWAMTQCHCVGEE
jgi:hypothetical protein